MKSKINAATTKKLTATGILFQVAGYMKAFMKRSQVAVPMEF